MTRLHNLRDIADETLEGLTADRSALQQILNSQRPRTAVRRPLTRVLALACALVFVFGIGALSLRFLQGSQVPEISTHTAGDPLPGGKEVASNVPRGSITLVKSGEVPKYMGVWARGSGGNFPLVRADGRYYRLLTNPTAIDSSMLGSSLGQVSIFTDEPALDNGNDVLSNVVQEGYPVYAVSGMGGSAVAAEVDGKLRVFQRVSFAGTALAGGEGLAGTLAGQVTGLQLSGVGSITDEQKANQLMQTLLSTASYKSSSSRTADQALLVRYRNGIVLQLSVSDNSISACGTWDAEEFLNAFKEAVQ